MRIGVVVGRVFLDGPESDGLWLASLGFPQQTLARGLPEGFCPLKLPLPRGPCGRWWRRKDSFGRPTDPGGRMTNSLPAQTLAAIYLQISRATGRGQRFKAERNHITASSPLCMSEISTTSAVQPSQREIPELPYNRPTFRLSTRGRVSRLTVWRRRRVRMPMFTSTMN
jgi:hypothetical protein